MGFFDGIGNVDPSGSSPRFPPDMDAIVRVHECRVHQGQWGTRYIMEGDVLQSNNPSVSDGARHSWTVKIDGSYAAMGLGEVKALVAACKGIDPNNTAQVNATVTPAVVDSTLADSGNSLRGTVVRTQTSLKTTKGGHDIVKHLWMVVDPAEAAMLASGAPPLGAYTPPAAAPAAPGVPGGLASAGGAFPPAGWAPHPDSPGYFYKGQEVLTEVELRAKVAPAVPAAPLPPAPAAPPVPMAAPTPPPPVAAAPAAPPVPMAAPPAPVTVAWPPAGWAVHPQSPGYWFKGQEVITEAQLRERASRGAA